MVMEAEIGALLPAEDRRSQDDGFCCSTWREYGLHCILNSDSSLQNLNKFLLFYLTQCVALCYGRQGKLTQASRGSVCQCS